MAKRKEPNPIKALKHYFAAKRDLDARYPDKRDVTYMVFRNGLRTRLSEDNHTAYLALDTAEDMLKSHHGMSNEQCNALGHLEKISGNSHYETWMTEHIAQNLERLAIQIAICWQMIQVADVPVPSPEAIKRHEEARNHQLGKMEAKPEPKAAAKPADITVEDWEKHLSAVHGDNKEGRAEAIDAIGRVTYTKAPGHQAQTLPSPRYPDTSGSIPRESVLERRREARRAEVKQRMERHKEELQQAGYDQASQRAVAQHGADMDAARKLRLGELPKSRSAEEWADAASPQRRNIG